MHRRGLPALRLLSLRGNFDCGNAGAVALAGAGTALSALRSLDVCNMGLFGSRGVAAIAGAWRRQLVCLNLTNKLGRSGIAALVRADWPALRLLRLFCCRLGDDGFKQLMQADGMRALQVLDAGFNELDAASLEALAGALEAGRLPRLRELCFAHNHFDDEHSPSALARAAARMLTLRVLNLVGCRASQATLEALAGAALLALDMLMLCYNRFGDGGLQIIAGAPWAARLRTLGVAACDVSHDVLLDALPAFPRLDVLDVGKYVSLPGWVYDPDFELRMGEEQDELTWTLLRPGAHRRLAATGVASV